MIIQLITNRILIKLLTKTPTMSKSLNSSLLIPKNQYIMAPKNTYLFHSSSTQNSRRRTDTRCGKIVKNGSIDTANRIKTQVSTVEGSCRMEITGGYGFGKRNGVQIGDFIKNSSDRDNKYRLRSQASLQSYESKLAKYESNKKSVLRDIGRMNTQQFIINNKNNNPQTSKTQHFFTTKLKQSLKSSIIPKSQPQSQSQSFNKQNIQQRKQNQSTEITRFVRQIDQQIRLESQLRKLKHQITTGNRKQVIEMIKKYYSKYDYDCQQITKICYQEYQFPNPNPNPNNNQSHKTSTIQISGQILAQKLLQTYQQCQHNWYHNLTHKFDPTTMRRVYEMLNFQNKVELDLKYFVREWNLCFGKGYLPKELWRIYTRIGSVSKINFVTCFSEQKF